MKPTPKHDFSRRQHAGLKQDVDMLILDVYLYQAIDALLNARDDERRYMLEQVKLRKLGSSPSTSTRESLARPLHFDARHLFLVHNFLKHCKETPKRKNPPQSDGTIAFRIQLLKFTALFTRRFDKYADSPPAAALQELRSKNMELTNAFRATSDLPPIENTTFLHAAKTAGQLAAHIDGGRAAIVEQMFLSHNVHPQREPSNDVHDKPLKLYGQSDLPLLQDLLPVFLELTAARASMSDDGWVTTEPWLHLVANFMLQSCLELWMLKHEADLAIIPTVFAFQLPVGDVSAKLDDAAVPKSVAEHVKELGKIFELVFTDAAGQTVSKDGGESWRKIRAETVSRLTSMQVPESDDPAAASELQFWIHVDDLRMQDGAADFEERMLTFLRGLVESLPPPALLQLDQGTMHGLSAAEVEKLHDIVRNGF